MERLNGVGVRGYGILFTRSTGKPVRTLEGNVPMLKMYGMNNVSASRDYVVVGEDNIIYAYFEGQKNSMPIIHKDMVGVDAMEIGIDVSIF